MDLKLERLVYLDNQHVEIRLLFNNSCHTLSGTLAKSNNFFSARAGVLAGGVAGLSKY